MKENPQGYFGPYLDRQETADLIGKYVESHLVFLFQGIPPSYLKHILKHGVLETEPAYADDVKLVFNVWYPSARSTVPTLQRSVDNRVYGYVAFLTTEALRHFDLNMGTELRDGEHWHKRTRTLITLPQRPQPNRVWAWSYRISKPSFAPTRERLVTRPYKQAMADMLNEIGWKHNDSRAVTWKDVEEGRPPIRRNPAEHLALPLDTVKKVLAAAEDMLSDVGALLARTARPAYPIIATLYRNRTQLEKCVTMDDALTALRFITYVQEGVVGQMVIMVGLLDVPEPTAEGRIEAYLHIFLDANETYVSVQPFTLTLHGVPVVEKAGVRATRANVVLGEPSGFSRVDEVANESKPPGTGGYCNPGIGRSRLR